MDIYSILTRATQVSGVEGLTEIYARHREAINTVVEDGETEIQRIRDELPNTKTRARFDREMRRTGRASEQQRQEKRRKRIIATNLRRIRKLKERLSHLENPEPRLIPTELWLNAQTIIADTQGRVIAEFARQTSNKIAIARIHRAALGFPDGKGKPAYSYAGLGIGSLRARSIFALGYLLVHLSRGTRRRGRWSRLVTGIPQSAFATALSDPNSPFREKRGRRTISGVHRSLGQPGEIGYLDALKAAEFCHTRQAKWRGDRPTARGWSDIRPEEIAGERDGLTFSLARYWIITDRYKDPREAAEQAQLWVDWLAGCMPFASWLDAISDALSKPDVHGKISGFCSEKPPD